MPRGDGAVGVTQEEVMKTPTRVRHSRAADSLQKHGRHNQENSCKALPLGGVYVLMFKK